MQSNMTSTYKKEHNYDLFFKSAKDKFSDDMTSRQNLDDATNEIQMMQLMKNLPNQSKRGDDFL